jgi:GNAT superfamily N-acetyltransferase
MIEIVKLVDADRAAWQELFAGYNEFYGRGEMPAGFYERAWSEFQDDSRMHALGARLDGQLVGIAHFLTHPSTTSPDACYLQDLFTAPEARGKGAARALIGQVTEWARTRGCGRLYWSTQDTNARARKLYDEVAEHRGFLVYQISL